jgi:2-oxoisovalerate dehydrogenase E1 component
MSMSPSPAATIPAVTAAGAAADRAPAASAELDVAAFRRLAEEAPDPAIARLPEGAVALALRIRAVEEKFLELFAQGRMNGTVHTCVGQEFSAVAVAGALRAGDWVTSNHRCHGHFIAKTGNWQGLLDELMGLESGVCRGVGSSQHLYAQGFLSNGPQGALVPVASGIAHHLKETTRDGVAVSFIGEGTLGEGVLYEAMNLSALWALPHLIVCENNLYSQSTPQATGIAGGIAARAAAFGIPVFEADTWNLPRLFAESARALTHVRIHRSPAFLLIRTYRLNAHSKGDDDRATGEVHFFGEHDPLNRLRRSPAWVAEEAKIRAAVDAHVAAAADRRLTFGGYVRDQLPRARDAGVRPLANGERRMVQALNAAYGAALGRGALMVGEDIADPYGGAFKVTRGLAQRFPGRVLTTPISEAAIAGFGTGVALMGRRAFVEIMFGDFVTNIFDQLLSNASKFHHMYAFQASVPVRVRTPMGGKRGYGPTHSQSLEKFLVGIDNVCVAALTSLDDPEATIEALDALPGPVVIVESKVDYGRFLWRGDSDFAAARVGGPLGTIVVTPLRRQPNVTVVAYGETARHLADHLRALFVETDCVVELVSPLVLHPLHLDPIEQSVRATGALVVVEDASVEFGIGAEVIARLVEAGVPFRARRVGAEPVPIPSVASLEGEILPTVAKVKHALRAFNDIAG